MRLLALILMLPNIPVFAGLTMNIPLSPVRPQYVFSLHTNGTQFNFNVGGSSDFKLSISLEEMKTLSFGNNKNSSGVCQKEEAYLVLEAKNDVSGEISRSIKLCMEVNHAHNRFQTVDYVLDGTTMAVVRAEGDWSELFARMVASIYYEVKDGCGNCGPGYFCCGSKDQENYRCIPTTDYTICNGHPNCGFFSNADEISELCLADIAPCMGAECHLEEVVLRISILILCCLLLPPLAILLITRLKLGRELLLRIRRTRRRGPSTNTTTGSRPPDSSSSGVFAERPQSRTSISSSSTPPMYPGEDPPPTYDEFMRSHEDITDINVIGRKGPFVGAERESESGNGSSGFEDGGVINPSFSHSLTTGDSVP